jgi:flavin reductase (DIM6/NTAB) family NADH-FMN oxidoreductase RutF
MTAIASVTDTPPTLLVCLKRTTAANGLIRANGVFCVSILPGGADDLAEAFAGRGTPPPPDRFALAAWSVLATGAPALDSARAVIDCRLTEVSDIGTHSVMLGAVVAVRFGAPGSALVYLDRAYRDLA